MITTNFRFTEYIVVEYWTRADSDSKLVMPYETSSASEAGRPAGAAARRLVRCFGVPAGFGRLTAGRCGAAASPSRPSIQAGRKASSQAATRPSC